MAKADDAVEMPTLGRPFQLGMLYDCRKELLIPGITLWDLDTLRNYVDVRSQNKTEFQIIASDSMEDKASALDIKASLQVSFLSGLVEVSGSAEYLRDNRSSKHQARVTLQYSATTQFKQLTMNQLGRQNISYPDVFDQGTATHVVIAVLYGAQAFFVFDREVSENENIQEIQGRLKLTISGIPATKIEGEASVKIDEKDKSFTEKFSCRFHGDFALESNPVTYEDAMRVYAALPKMLGANGEKAVPVKVWLYPLTKLDSKAARLVREISLALVFDAQTALEQLTELDMRCNDLQRNPVAASFPEIKRKLQQFKDLCKQHRQAFQKELAGVLPSIRGGGKEEGALAEILTNIGNSPFNIQRLNEFLDAKEQEMNFMKVFTAVLKDVSLVSSRSELQRIVLDPTKDFVTSFTFTSLEEEEPHLLDLHKWLRYTKSHVNPPSAGPAPEERDPKQWFEKTEIYTKVRELAKAFSEFAAVNKDDGKTQFVVSSVPDKSHPGATIYLYEAGKICAGSLRPSSALVLRGPSAPSGAGQVLAGFNRSEELAEPAGGPGQGFQPAGAAELRHGSQPAEQRSHDLGYVENHPD
nr:PREDICTED: stonustoxin subunit alpha-like [Apteryx mantelli mantelli]